jgi:hypothetical protein
MERRIDLLNSVLGGEDGKKISTQLRHDNGDLPTTIAKLKDTLPAATLERASLIHSLSAVTLDKGIVGTIANDPEISSLRDVALHYDNTKLAAAPLTQPSEQVTHSFQQQLFFAEPSAVLQRMMQGDEMSVHEPSIKAGLSTFLANQPNFNIRTTSVLTALKHPGAFDGIEKDLVPKVTEHLKTLQRVQALAPSPEAIPVLLEAGFKSAYQVSSVPKTRFIKDFTEKLGVDTAAQIHAHAINSRIKQETTLATLHQMIKGTGVPAIDGASTRAERFAILKSHAFPFESGTVNLTQLFGSMDYCQCDDCVSILSPAAYYVELLQYLRNNNQQGNLVVAGTTPSVPVPDQPGYAGTTLDMLLHRRPDLANLELTCANTNTVLPYIDLSNEVMESFVVHLRQYKTQTPQPGFPKQATLEVFNVEDEPSALLLAAPQHTNFNAYCIIKDSVYPFSAPYHRGIDEIRILLNYLGTSYSALLDTFRDAYVPPATPSSTDSEMKKLHTIIRNRAVDSEYLGLTLDQYKIITKEAFWPIEYFNITQSTTFTVAQYQTDIGIQPDYTYWGYPNAAEETSTHETSQTGLTFVEAQFLTRSGITYINLVDLLETQYVNPNYPSGWALTVMESLRFSYRFLATLVDEKKDAKDKYCKLIKFLNRYQPLAELYQQYIDNGGLKKECPEHRQCTCGCHSDYTFWVCKYFEAIGKLIVLDSGDGPTLKLEGWLVAVPPPPTPPPTPPSTVQPKVIKAVGSTSTPPQATNTTIGYLNRDGSVTDNTEKQILQVTPKGVVVDMDNNPLLTSQVSAPYSRWSFAVQSTDQLSNVGYIDSQTSVLYPIASLDSRKPKPVQWGEPQDSCNLTKVRLVHLDGSPVTDTEYDGMQRFLRLWMKLGWTIDQLDKALVGLAANPTSSGSSGSSAPPTPPTPAPVSFSDLEDVCSGAGGTSGGSGNGSTQCSCAIHGSDTPVTPTVLEITPHFLSQLVAVQKILALTSLPLTNLLAFWATISTAGDASLYSQLFLTPDLVGMDTVFNPDNNGNYLAQTGILLSDHYPVLMAAFHLSSLSDFTALITFLSLTDLTLASVSILYRYIMLAQYLGIRVSLWNDVVALFGVPFASAEATLKFLNTWNRLQATNFTFAQLNYIVRGVDNPLQPIGPSQLTILQTSKTLYDGLTAINTNNPDLAPGDTASATPALVTAEATQLFSSTIVAQILGLLLGTMTYTTNAPVNLTITIPTTLGKLKYINQPTANPPQATLQATGILTADETTVAKALSTNSAWSTAIDRLGVQPSKVFDDVLSGIFTDVTSAKQALLAGDVLTADPTDPNSPPLTPPIKCYYFLQYFLPFLRFSLADKLVIDTMSAVSQMPTSDLTRLFLENILKVGGVSAMDILKNLAQSSQQTGSDWIGTLVPPTTDTYTFVAISDTAPQPLVLAGQSLPFVYQQADPSNVWWTTSVPLVGGTLYSLTVAGQSASALQWKTATTTPSTIPSSSLLPGASTGTTTTVFVQIFKCSFFVSGFNLSSKEVSYFQANPSDFSGFDFNAIILQHWQRLDAYTTLRNSLPSSTTTSTSTGTPTTLIDLFAWATANNPASGLVAEIVAVTQWDTTQVTSLINTPTYFNLPTPSSFRNEINLIAIQKALNISNSVVVDIPTLFSWTTLPLKFWPSLNICASIRKTIRGRYTLTNWEQVVQPLNNTIRENQKNALIAYLLVQPSLQAQGIQDADGLFEFFLIDVQMSSCLQTSRIKQAISTVQLFVQRCLLGLEAPGSNMIDQYRWESMQSQPLYVARRNVFLYPENWMVPSLRDDKSPFYLDFESELLQNAVTITTATTAVADYLYSLDSVGKLEATGLFYDAPNNILHICARTVYSPYLYFYRNVNTSNGAVVWTPWQSMQVDIPNYTVETSTGGTGPSGTYLTPVVYYGRLMVFFLQFVKKTQPATTASATTSFADVGNSKSSGPSAQLPIEYWDVTLCYSEFRNGQWTPKQIAKDPVTGAIPTTPNSLPSVDSFQVVPRFSSIAVPNSQLSETQITFDIYMCGSTTTNIGSYTYANGRLTAALPNTSPYTSVSLPSTDQFITSFQYINYQTQPNGTVTTGITTPEAPPSTTLQLNSYQELGSQAPTTGGAVPPQYFPGPPCVWYPNLLDRTSKPQAYISYLLGNQPLTPGTQPTSGAQTTPTTESFSHDFVHILLGLLTSTQDLDDLFAYFNTMPESYMPAAFGSDPLARYNELSASYALYNWELAFHIPMALVTQLRSTQQYDLALKVLQYIFNPYGDPTDPTSYWKFRPFQEIVSKDYLEDFFASLQPFVLSPQINAWRDNPFSPYVLGRMRPVAFMKWVVMTYIGTLIDYGDYYFRQNTLESVPLAIQCYVLADHIYGPVGQEIPKRGTTKVETYASLLNKWDPFENAVVDMELMFPFSNQITTKVPKGWTKGDDLPNIFGFTTTYYFCIPGNPNLTDLKATIDDRLFKIRHCQNIDGVVQKLALFEPPLNIAELVQAAASGISISSVLNGMNSSLSNYRFLPLMQKALEMCNELKTLGGEYLSAREKGDSEALQVLRAHQESVISSLVMQVKQLQVNEATATLDGLNTNRLAPVARLTQYLTILGQDSSGVPDPDTDFLPLVATIEAPSTTDVGVILSPSEQQEMDAANEAATWLVGVGIAETLASILHAFPVLHANACPFGVGAEAVWGPKFMGDCSMAVARGLRCVSDQFSHDSSMAGRKASFQRQVQDRILQANNAGYEIKSIDKQIVTQNVRISIANQEITNQQKVIDNNAEIETFLNNKYTNVALYSWLSNQTQSLYYQTYTVAYDLANRAQQAYYFERPLETGTTFIQFGYWDPTKNGLLAAEQLLLGLKQMEAAYQDHRGYDFEVSKNISLRQTNPLVLMQLRETGTCSFSFPEILFDMDFPGQYNRRIKTIAITIPCVVGPYVGVTATLRLTAHKYRTSPTAKDANDYLNTPQGQDDPQRFMTSNVPINAIATSTCQNDAGVFELLFRDERYMPFEGAGVISSWQLSLPSAFRQFDYSTITDVIVHVHYTSVDGGNNLQTVTSSALASFVKNVQDLSQDLGLFSFFDLKNEFSSSWYQAMNPATGATQRIINLDNLNDRLPIYTLTFTKSTATDIFLFSSSAIAASVFSIVLANPGVGGGGEPITFVSAPSVGIGSSSLNVFQALGKTQVISSWQVIISDVTTQIDDMFMIVRFTLS